MLKKVNLFFHPKLRIDSRQARSLEQATWLVNQTLTWGLHHHESAGYHRFNPIDREISRVLYNYYDICHTNGQNHREIFYEAQRLEFSFLPRTDHLVEVEIKYFNRGNKAPRAELRTSVDDSRRFWDVSSIGM